jgi:transcriptional regulator with XRE-family HTH domain
MKIGEIIKLFRTKRGVSQKEMADKLGITPNYLSLIEADKKIPSRDITSEFAEKLGISKAALSFAVSDVPSELKDRDKEDFLKLQNNIIYLLLFNSKKDN